MLENCNECCKNAKFAFFYILFSYVNDFAKISNQICNGVLRISSFLGEGCIVCLKNISIKAFRNSIKVEISLNKKIGASSWREKRA